MKTEIIKRSWWRGDVLKETFAPGENEPWRERMTWIPPLHSRAWLVIKKFFNRN